MGEDEAVDNGTGTAVAEAPNETPDAGQTPAEGQSQGDGSQAPAWSGQPLPPDLASKYPGTKTWGDFAGRYENSSSEARRYQSEAESQSKLNRGYQALLAQMRQQQPQAPAIGQGNGNKGYLGFASQEAYSAAFQADPQGAIRSMIRHVVTEDPDLRKQLVDPAIQEHLQPVEQHMNEQRLAAQSQEFYGKYPDAKAGPLNEASASYLNANPWIMGIQRLAPQANLPEVVYKLATYDILAQQVKAASQKAASHSQSAGTARPGSGGRSVAKTDDPRSSVLAAVEHARSMGEEVPQALIDAAIRSVEQGDWNRGRKPSNLRR